MLRTVSLAALVLAAGCDAGADPMLPVLQIVGAELRAVETAAGPSLEVVPETREIDRVPAGPCLGPTVDCLPGVAANQTLPDRTRLVADRPVRIGDATVEAGGDLLAVLGGIAPLRLRVVPFAIVGLPLDGLTFEPGPTRLMASWETDDGLAFQASTTLNR